MIPNTKKIDIDGNSIYLKKSFFGYRVIHPYKNEDGSINWFNLITGGWSNLITTTLIVGFLLLILWSYKHDVSICQSCIANPCNFCHNFITNNNYSIPQLGKLNISILNLK